MKKQILSAVFTIALLAATAVRAQDNTNTPATNAPDATITNTNTPAPPPDQAPVPSNGTPQPAEQPPPAPSSTNTSSVVTLKNGEKGLMMNFRGVPLETVLNFMSDAAGYTIHPLVDVSGKVTAWNNQPLTQEEALKLLEKVLQENGYTAIQDEKTLTIMRSDQAIKGEGTHVFKGNDASKIPKNDTIATYIIPVRSLNVVQLAKNLQSLIGSSATMSADESANSIMLTDTQANIHRIVEIISALDSVTSGNASIEVFPLKYGDSKAIAQLIKDLFPSQDATGTGNGNRGAQSRFRGMMGAMMGGFPGGGGMPGGGGDTGGGENGHTPTAKISAVSDDHANAVVVSAPDELMPTLEHLIQDLDKPVEATTVAKLFHLKNADPGEMADLLTSLFPDDSSQSDASRSTMGFRGFPGFGGFGGGGQQNRSSSTESDRMKKMARVIAVPDRRTQSLLVTAGTNEMDQIEGLITELDSNNARKMKPFSISLQNADPVDVLPILQGLFPSSSPTSSSSTANLQQLNALQNRQTTLLQNQNNQNNTSSFGIGSGGRTGGN